MVQSEIVFYIIRLVLGGIAAFLAIMLWSRTRDAAWMSLVAGAITGYAGIVYEMLIKLGIASASSLMIGGISLSTLLFAVVPTLFFILAFILMLLRTR